MKKIIILMLLLGVENLGFSANTPKSVRITGLFPVDKLALLQGVTKDTLIFAYADTVQQRKHEWDVFYSHQYVASFVRNYYHKITIEHSAATQDVIVVDSELETGPSLQQISPYEEEQLSSRWIEVVLLLIIHLCVFGFLRKRLFSIHRDGRYETKQLQRKQTIKSILIAILICVVFGLFALSYFFLFFPVIYLIFIFLPASTWYSGMSKREFELDKKL